jgi:hypothetical protein
MGSTAWEGEHRDARDAKEPKLKLEPEGANARAENAALAITSLAAVATAWSAFQASTWSGNQMFELATAARARQQSTQARLEGDQQGHLDADLFVAYLGALVEHHEAFATFLYDRFPPRLKVATAAWLDTHPLESRSAPPHPFAMQEYRVEATERATTEEKEAGAADARATAANHNGDLYVLATVLLATVITVSSIASRLTERRGRRTTLVLCGALLLVLIVWLAWRPVAWVSPSA